MSKLGFLGASFAPSGVRSAALLITDLEFSNLEIMASDVAIQLIFGEVKTVIELPYSYANSYDLQPLMLFRHAIYCSGHL